MTLGSAQIWALVETPAVVCSRKQDQLADSLRNATEVHVNSSGVNLSDRVGQTYKLID